MHRVAARGLDSGQGRRLRQGCRGSYREPFRTAVAAGIGLIFDSRVLITAEHQGQNARQMLAAISSQARNTEIALSVVMLIELAHGAARPDTAQRKAKRQQFIQELLTALPIHPITVPVARFVPGKSMARTRPKEFAFLSPIC